MEKNEHSQLNEIVLKLFGEHVLQARKDQKYTQHGLADTCKLSQTAISKIENGVAVVDKATLVKVEEILGIEGALKTAIESLKNPVYGVCSNPDCNEVLPYYSGGEIFWKPLLHKINIDGGKCIYGHDLLPLANYGEKLVLGENIEEGRGTWITVGSENAKYYGLYEGFDGLENTIYNDLHMLHGKKNGEKRDLIKAEREQRQREHQDFVD